VLKYRESRLEKLLFEIKSTANVGTDGIKTLLFGGPGTGKTPMCATAPAPFIISAESGLLSLKSCNPPVPYVDIKNMRMLKDVYAWCASSNEARQFYTICLDSISEIMEVLLTEEKAKSKDPRKAYGELMDQGMAIARAFRDIPGKSVVVVAKQEFVKDETNGSMMFQASLPGTKLGPGLPYFFDEVFQMLVGRDQQNRIIRYVRTSPSYQVFARDRSGRLDEFEPNNFELIFRKILAI
jgi:hypothetical protein